MPIPSHLNSKYIFLPVNETESVCLSIILPVSSHNSSSIFASLSVTQLGPSSLFHLISKSDTYVGFDSCTNPFFLRINPKLMSGSILASIRFFITIYFTKDCLFEIWDPRGYESGFDEGMIFNALFWGGYDFLFSVFYFLTLSVRTPSCQIFLINFFLQPGYSFSIRYVVSSHFRRRRRRRRRRNRMKTNI